MNMDQDTTILRKAEKLEHLDLDTYDDLDHETAEEVSNAADRVTARYHALMKDMPVAARVAMVAAPTHPTEASVAKGAMMLTLIEEQTTRRANDGVSLQSVHDNVTELLGDSHFFEIVEQPAESCAMAVYATTGGWSIGGGDTGRSKFDIAEVPHAGVVAELLREHGFHYEEAVMLSRYVGHHDHAGMLRRILE